MRRQCEIKQRLLYFEMRFLFRFLNIMRECVQHIPYLLPTDGLLHRQIADMDFSDAVRFYEENDGTKLNSADTDALTNIAYELDLFLCKLCRHREILSADLKKIFIDAESILLPFLKQTSHTQVVLEKQVTIDRAMNCIMQWIKQEGGVSTTLQEQLENHLTQFEDSIRQYIFLFPNVIAIDAAVLKTMLQTAFGEHYGAAVRSAKKVCSLQKDWDAVTWDGGESTLLLTLHELTQAAKLLDLLRHMIQLYETAIAGVIKAREKKARLVFGSDYQEAYDRQKALLLLQCWCDFLNQKITHYERNNPRRVGTLFAFHMRKLLRLKKPYVTHYAQQEAGDVLNHLLMLDDGMQQLKQQQQQCQAQVKELESRVRQYSQQGGPWPALLHFASRMTYYQLANGYLNAAEEGTRTERFRTIPILNTPLSEGFLNFSKIIMAAAFLGIDVYFMQWLGLSYPMLQALSTLFVADPHWLIPMAIYCGINLLIAGVTLENAFFFIGCYGFSMSAKLGVDRLFAWRNRHTERETTDDLSQAHAFMMSLCTMAAFTLGGRLWQLVYYSIGLSRIFSAPASRELLKVCQTDPDRHWTTTVRNFGLDPHNITMRDINKRGRYLAKQYHPDRCKTTVCSNQYTLFSDMYEWLRRNPILPRCDRVPSMLL